MNIIECQALKKVYKSTKALDNLSLTIKANKITGLIGRNGAGKTTFLKIIAGFIRETSGEVKVFGQHPFNNLSVSANMIFVDDRMTLPMSLNLSELLQEVSQFYPNWNKELANGLFNYFSLNPKANHNSLSKGMKSTFNMIIGLASRCPLTIFDEPTTGMDASVRKDFYRALLKDYILYPRTIILSSHLLNEMENLLEDVLLLENGQKRLHLSVEDLKEYAIGLKGNKDMIQNWAEDKEVIYKREIGKDSLYVVIKNDLTAPMINSAKINELEITQVSCEDTLVYLTNQSKGDIDDVFNKS